MAYIKSVADLTVRISVERASENRPKMFCSSGSRGDIIITGTGYITQVDKDSMKYRTCVCKDCSLSASGKQEFALIRVCTSAQVVCDESEFSHTTCDVFCDRADAGSIFTLTDLYSFKLIMEGTSRALSYVTHDMNLADMLDDKLRNCRKLEKMLMSKYRPLTSQSHTQMSSADLLQPLAVIVSYPHGLVKQVSLGFCTGRYVVGEYHYTLLTYTTATCPGSAGALVSVLGSDRWSHMHVHGGSCEVNTKHSHSTLGLDFPLPNT